MKKLYLRFVAIAYPITGKLNEEWGTSATTMRELLAELDSKYGGFFEMFINTETGKLNLNTMIYYGETRSVPVAVLDVDQPISDGARITFW